MTSFAQIQKLALSNGLSDKPHFVSALAGAAASVLGSKLASKDAKSNARDANDFTTEQLQNRHQWEVADLRAAGLNPVLSAGGTPSIGNSAMAQSFNPADNIGNVTNSALAAQKLTQELKNMRATEKQINADANLKNKQSDVQDNIATTTRIAAEGADALLSLLGGKGAGANTASSVKSKGLDAISLNPLRLIMGSEAHDKLKQNHKPWFKRKEN